MVRARKYYPGMGRGLAEVAWLDDEDLEFGADADVTISWDGSALNILPLTNDIGAINIGNGTRDIDLKVFLGSTAEYAEFDVGNSRINLVGVPVLLTPLSQQAVGFQVVSQCVQAFKAEYDITAQQGAWVHGVKVELTRAANIQPVTGCWFAGQFVLNIGTGYDNINKPVYAIQAVIKGDASAPNGVDLHVGRFEIQSAGKVSDIVHILANTGCTVVGHLLYLASHINANGALINVQSSATMAKALSFMAGAGATLTSLLYASGDGTFTNFLEVAASGDGGLTIGAMSKNPESQAEDGYLTVLVGATPYQVPIYLA